jgi:hypothetical protein
VPTQNVLGNSVEAMTLRVDGRLGSVRAGSYAAKGRTLQSGLTRITQGEPTGAIEPGTISAAIFTFTGA